MLAAASPDGLKSRSAAKALESFESRQAAPTLRVPTIWRRCGSVISPLRKELLNIKIDERLEMVLVDRPAKPRPDHLQNWPSQKQAMSNVRAQRESQSDEVVWPSDHAQQEDQPIEYRVEEKNDRQAQEPSDLHLAPDGPPANPHRQRNEETTHCVEHNETRRRHHKEQSQNKKEPRTHS
eukprot:CAMPEP_0194481514 /NCGR_PEP_ID=MMETSP0253-20130528/3903_1 /TAXON_ID=2966 /ORGANISM="Noctiluca scintillans" /LENGTH=179 /DNA_ID=CAMNT_0039321003 /DNA_START=100 /DNA_END=640 /DNA_ORIENTATION=+